MAYTKPDNMLNCVIFLNPLSRKRVKNQGFCFETILFMCYSGYWFGRYVECFQFEFRDSENVDHLDVGMVMVTMVELGFAHEV